MDVNHKWPPRERDPTWTPAEWRALTPEEREWYTLFWQANERGNMAVLQELADSSEADFENLKKEIKYEGRIGERVEYTVPIKRFPKYSEWDYGWAEPLPCPVKYLAKSHDTDADEAGEIRMDKNVVFPSYDKGPGAVRKVSEEEYWRTRKVGLPKGVNLETELKYAEELEEMAKNLPVVNWDEE